AGGGAAARLERSMMKTMDGTPSAARDGAEHRAPRLLMCAPESYDVKYEINDWMSIAVRPDRERARQQWAELHRVLTDEVGARVELVQQATDAPDMVFTANAG